MLGIFLWRESARIRKEASDAHEKIGQRIDGVEKSLSARIRAVEKQMSTLTGYIRGWLKQDMPEATMIYVTHDQVEAMTLASRIVVLHGGGIEQVGPPLELYEQPANEFVAKFIGSPAMNMLPGKISKSGAWTEIALDAGGTAVSSIPTDQSELGRKVTIGVRPEDFEVADNEPMFSSVVEFSEALGEVTLLYFRQRPGDPDKVIAKLAGIRAGLRGSAVGLTADPARVHLFADGVSMRPS